METEFRDKDKILAEPILKDAFNLYENIVGLLKKEKYYVLNIRNIGLVLKQVELKDNEIVLKSLNIDYPDRSIDKDDILNIWVVKEIIKRIL